MDTVYNLTIYVIDIFNLYVDEFGLLSFYYFIHVLLVLISILAPFHFIFILSVLKSETPIEILKFNIVLRRIFKYTPTLLKTKHFILSVLIWVALFVLLFQIDIILLSKGLRFFLKIVKYLPNPKIIITLIQLRDLTIIIVSLYILFIYSFYSAYNMNKHLKLSK